MSFSDQYPYAGQNLAVFMTTESYTIDEIIDKSMEAWFNEYIITSLRSIQYFDGSNVQ